MWVGVTLLLATQALGEIVNRDRVCPDGFWYAGESIRNDNNYTTHGSEIWEKGPTSQIYSCYSATFKSIDWAKATRRCANQEGNLLSVNNAEELDILNGDTFRSKAFADEDPPNLTLFTSGVSLIKGKWTWFGAGDNEVQVENVTITSTNSTNNTDYTQCLAITFSKNNTELVFTWVPCMLNQEGVICEVRVYEQVWYVWFTTNWLQVLFLFTLALLLISACVTFQMWIKRPSRNTSSPSRSSVDTPPAYSQTQQNTFASTADKYAEKGKELMAKVVFYRKSEDRQKLTTNA